MRRSTIAIFLAIVGFVAVIIYSATRQSKVECEMCITFNGRQACRASAAATRRDAETGARTAACAALGSGVNDAVACQRVPPSRLHCKKR